jgi:glycosyltransferase involved in cell wall biosynthesis
MRILVGLPEPGSRGGSVASEPPFVAELRRLVTKVGEEVYTYSDSQVGPVTRVLRVLRTVKNFRRRVRNENFDVVHLNTSFDLKALLRDCFTAPLLHFNGTKVFLKFHGSDHRLLATRNPIFYLMRGWLFSRVDGIGVLSHEERANFLRAGVAEEKIFVVSNVVDVNEIGRDPDFASRISLREGVPLLLFSGRFIPEKGVGDCIEACKLLRERGQEFMLVCLGDGPARRKAEREVQRLKLQDHVRFVGHVSEEEAKVFYANGTALLFPTYHSEGFPMTIFHAAAAGLPIITTRIRAAADYLHEPDNCLWVTARRPNVLADRIIDLLQNAELQRKMRDNNKEVAIRFSQKTVTSEYLKVYEQILERGGDRLGSMPAEESMSTSDPIELT